MTPVCHRRSESADRELHRQSERDITIQIYTHIGGTRETKHNRQRERVKEEVPSDRGAQQSSPGLSQEAALDK